MITSPAPENIRAPDRLTNFNEFFNGIGQQQTFSVFGGNVCLRGDTVVKRVVWIGRILI